ncbi:MAG: metallophosphoesterase family protein [Chloroflexota bacterium]
MRYAIFADIHNQAAALAEMLRHAREQGVDSYFCLGDVGIDDCVDQVRQADAPAVFGNWEVSGWRYLSGDNRRWALQLPAIRRQAGFWLTHAAPLWPDNLATLADLNANRRQIPLSRLFPYLHHESTELWETIAVLTRAGVPLLFHGHTHRQLAWRFTAGNQLQQSRQRRLSIRPGETLIIGVGSVGRPLDGPTAAYVIYDEEAQQVELVTT